MKRIPNLIEFCRSTGILNVCETTRSVKYGCYGELLLKQIESEWLRANFTKFNTSFIMESHNLLDEKAADQFGLKNFADSLSDVFELQKLPFSLLNIAKSNKEKLINWNKCEASMSRFNEETHFYSDNRPQMFTHLNSFHFCNDEHNEHNDSLSFWQRERKNWWIKLFNCPENVEMKSKPLVDENFGMIDLFYRFEPQEEKESKWLENIKYFENLKNHQCLRSLLNSFGDHLLIKNSKKLIVTQTTAQNVLESILHDSVEYRRKKSDVLKNCTIQNEKDKLVFRLDYRLAPYKACIIYQKSSSTPSTDETNCEKLATDLRKLFVYHQINVFVISFDSQKESIQDKYDKLDVLGVPYSVYLNTSLVLKDGFCAVRNRDTTLEEHLHISHVVDQFRAISNALNY
jgi:glycyl-tRNA synthetase (class II)